MATKYIPVIPTDDSYKFAFAATKNPQPNGEASPGDSECWAREDHVHPGYGEGGACAFTPGYAGHVTANVSNVSLTDAWTGGSGAYRRFDIQSGNIEIAGYPNTIPSKGSDGTLFIVGATPEDGRLRENNRSGQVHLWRFSVEYSGLDSDQQYYFIGRLSNPDSGFELNVTQTIFTTNDATSGTISFSFETIADSDSLGDGRGYEFGIIAIFNSWSSGVLDLTKILRTSLAMENGVVSAATPELNVLVIDDDNKDQYIEYETDNESPDWGIWLSIPTECDIVNIQASDLMPEEFKAVLEENGTYYDTRLRGIRPKTGDFNNYQRLTLVGNENVKFWAGTEQGEPYSEARYIMPRFWRGYKQHDYGLYNDAFSELMFMNGKWWSTYY